MSRLYQGIDLSRFKKIASDGKTSTLRHSQGHEIKIAHKGLSPKMEEHLSGMPLHLADGDPDGGVDQAAAEPIGAPKEAPLSINVTPSSYYPTAQPAQAQPMALPPPQIQQVSAVASPEDDMDEHVKVTHDLATGKITPETYQSLYGKQDTLGKIGTLFGLMVSGAGSGLAHQSNMVMDMMNKQIDNDLEAQKQNVGNKRNFLSLQYQHDLQDAQAREANMRTLNQGIEGAGRAAGTAKALETMGVPDSGNFLKDYMTQANAILTPARAKAKMVVAAANHLDKSTQNNLTANAIVKNQVIPAANEQATQGLAAAHEKVKTLGPPPSVLGGNRPTVVDEDKLAQAIQLGHYVPPGTPGAINPLHEQIVQREKASLGNNRDLAQSWNEGYNKLMQLKNAGEVPGISEGATALGSALGFIPGIGPIIGGLGGAGLGHTAGKIGQDYFERKRSEIIRPLRERLGKGMSDQAKDELINSIMPSWKDDEQSAIEAHNQGIQHFRDLEKEIAPNLMTYGKKIPDLVALFPDLQIVKKKKTGSKK